MLRESILSLLFFWSFDHHFADAYDQHHHDYADDPDHEAHILAEPPVTGVQATTTQDQITRWFLENKVQNYYWNLKTKVLDGALVGGPDHNDNYVDDRTNFQVSTF